MTDKKQFKGGEFLIVDASPEEIFAPEDITKEQRLIGQAAKDFALKELLPRADELDDLNPDLIKSLLRKAGELGLTSLVFPEEYGGAGDNFVTTALVMEQIPPGGASFAFTFSAQSGMPTLVILLFGTPEQKEKYVSRLGAGELIPAFALTEPDHGSDALGIESTASLSEDGKHYILNGQKVFISNAGFMDIMIAFAKVDGDKFSAFIVEREWDGISTDDDEVKMGLHGMSNRPVSFQNVKVPVESLLGEVGRGHVVCLNPLNTGRMVMGTVAMGTIKTLIAEAVNYAKSRIQFGRPICEFGLIKHKISEMVIRCYALESMCYRLANILDLALEDIDLASEGSGIKVGKQISEYSAEGSINKVFGTETLDFVADESVQIMGGYGYIQGNVIERSYRDSRINRIWEGTNEINRLLIAETLIKNARNGGLALFDAIEDAKSALENHKPEEKGDQGPLHTETSIVRISKKVALAAVGLAIEKYKAQLREEQEVEALIADMAIYIFAMESALLRASKNIGDSNETMARRHHAVVSAYIRDTFPKILSLARQVAAASCEGETLDNWLSAMKKCDEFPPINTIPLRREIADEVISIARYPFARI